MERCHLGRHRDASHRELRHLYDAPAFSRWRDRCVHFERRGESRGLRHAVGRRQTAAPHVFGFVPRASCRLERRRRGDSLRRQRAHLVRRETRPYAIACNGGEPRELQLGHARAFSMGPDGALVLGRNAFDPARWKRYRGGTSGEIWTDAAHRGDFEKLKLPDGNPAWPMWSAISFTSSPITKASAISTRVCSTVAKITRHSNEAEYYARFPSTDGSRIVYSSGGADKRRRSSERR